MASLNEKLLTRLAVFESCNVSAVSWEASSGASTNFSWQLESCLQACVLAVDIVSLNFVFVFVFSFCLLLTFEFYFEYVGVGMKCLRAFSYILI